MRRRRGISPFALIVLVLAALYFLVPLVATLLFSLDSLQTSAENDDASAQFALAQLYEAGDAIEQDLAAARHWYERAAFHGHPQAIMGLGECYEHGKGVEKDLQEALKWYRLALKEGLDAAQAAIDRILGRPDSIY